MNSTTDNKKKKEKEKRKKKHNEMNLFKYFFIYDPLQILVKKNKSTRSDCQHDENQKSGVDRGMSWSVGMNW